MSMSELKIQMTGTSLDRFRRRSVLRQLSSSPARTCKQLTTYFDTDDHSLRAGAMSLRIHKENGKWVQIIKTATNGNGGLHEQEESESIVSGPVPDLTQIPDPGLRASLETLIGDKPVSPIFETEIWRTTRDLEIREAGRVELALDSGVIRAGEKTRPLHEVELELKTGRTDAILSAAEALFEKDFVSTGTENKTEWGYALLRDSVDQNDGEIRPIKSAKPRLIESMTAREALMVIGGAAVEGVLANWRATLYSDDPEGPHQMRVSLRRLRTAIWLLKPLTSSADFRAVAADAKLLARHVGRLRDADVLIDDIYHPACSALSTEPGDRVLMRALEARRDALRREVRKSITKPKWSRFKLGCMCFDQLVARSELRSNGSHPTPSLKELSRKALNKSWRGVKKFAKKLDRLSVNERHEMRKALKKLRYATEFFAPLYPAKQSDVFLRRLKRLQDVFGYLNDVAMAQDLPKALAREGVTSKPKIARGAAILAWHEGRAKKSWRNARKDWLELAAAPKFWRTKDPNNLPKSPKSRRPVHSKVSR